MAQFAVHFPEWRAAVGGWIVRFVALSYDV